MESKAIQRCLTQVYKIMRDLENATKARLLILSLNIRSGSPQKGSKQTERGYFTQHIIKHCNSLLQYVEGVKTLHGFEEQLESSCEINLLRVIP